MLKIIKYFSTVSLLAATAQAANSNAPIIIDANATSAYVSDGSRTNRMSPPVPGVPPLRSVTITPQFVGKGTLAATETPAPQAAPVATAPRAPLTAAAIAEANPNASYRFIDKRPLGMNIAPVANESVYTLDNVPEDQQRNKKAEQSPASLSPAR